MKLKVMKMTWIRKQRSNSRMMRTKKTISCIGDSEEFILGFKTIYKRSTYNINVAKETGESRVK